MSLSLLEDFDLECVDERVVAGLKNRVKRRGVMDGGFLGLLLLLATIEEGATLGEDGSSALQLCGASMAVEDETTVVVTML
jgi:hypothetical protein